MKSFTIFATVLVVIGTLARPAIGQDKAPNKKDEARALHDRGLELYGEGRYAEAIEVYQKAYDLMPAAGILFNLAQAHRRLDDCAKALELFEMYVHEKPDGAKTAVAREHIETARACVAARTSAEGSKPSPFGDPETTPTKGPAPAPVPRGPGPIDSVDPADSGSTKRLVGFGVGAAGAVSLSVGLIFGLQARSAQKEIDDFFQQGGTWGDEQLALEAKGQRANSRMIGFTSVGAAAVVAGGLIYVLGMREDSEGDAPVAIQPTRDSAMMVWSGSF